jgi:hypothetical protein
MSTWFHEAQFELPSVRRFFSEIASDLASRRNVLVLLPKQVNAEDVSAALLGELGRRTFDCGELPLSSISLDRSPEAFMCRVLGVQTKSQDPEDQIAAVYETPGLPRVLFLNGLCELQTEAQKEWLSFLVRFARQRAGISVKRQSGTTICAVVAAENILTHLPEPDVGLVFRWWWGFPSNLEMQVLCREAADQRGGPSAQWREALMLAFAGTDVPLLDVLWTDPDDTIDHKKEVLARWGLQMGWSAEDLMRNRAREVGALSEGHGVSLGPPARFRRLWAQGGLYSTIEFGDCLHPAALNFLGQEHQLDHRIWLAQSNLVFGWVNLVRLGVCELLSSRYPSDWAWRWSPPTDARESERLMQSSMNCDLSHLKHLLTHIREFRSERALLPLVEKAYNLRNPLAHHALISYEEVENLWEEVHQTLVGEHAAPASLKKAAG